MAVKRDEQGQVGRRPRDRDILSTYGPSRLTCGLEMCRSVWIILVEGRSDVRRLSFSGYPNSLEMDGARIDPSVREACSSKHKIVAFLDGDRSGDLIMRTLRSMVRLDYELRADPETEVEDTPPERIAQILDPVKAEIERGLGVD